jgi:hypothetical protein
MGFSRWNRALALVAAVLLAASCWLLVIDPEGPVRPVLERSAGTFGSLGAKAAMSGLIFPAAALLGIAALTWFSGVGARVGDELERMRRRDAWVATLSLGCFVMGVSRVLMLFVAREQPVSDHESVARFGGQLLALGKFSVEAPPFFDVLFPRTLLHFADGQVAGSEWLGVELAWAVAEVTRLGPFLFAAANGVSVGAIAVISARWLGPRYAALPVLVFLTSPMVLASGATADGHVLSRGLLALTVALAHGGRHLASTPGIRPLASPRWFAVGLCAGLALVTSPFEAVGALLPFAAVACVRAARSGAEGTRVALGTVVFGAMFPLAALLVQQAAVTGHFWLPTRFSPHVIDRIPFLAESISQTLLELGSMGALWFWGPLGLLLAWYGARAMPGATGGVDHFGPLLAWSAAGVCLGGLFAPTHSVAQAGPLAFAEAAVPLSLLAARGVLRANAAARERWPVLRRRFAGALPLVPAVVALAMSSLVFALWNMAELRRAQKVHETVNTIFDRPDLPRSVVLAPPYAEFRNSFDDFRDQESAITSWRRARPDLTERAVILEYGPHSIDALRAAFPGRKIMRLHRVDRLRQRSSGMVIEPAHRHIGTHPGAPVVGRPLR